MGLWGTQISSIVAVVQCLYRDPARTCKSHDSLLVFHPLHVNRLKKQLHLLSRSKNETDKSCINPEITSFSIHTKVWGLGAPTYLQVRWLFLHCSRRLCISRRDFFSRRVARFSAPSWWVSVQSQAKKRCIFLSQESGNPCFGEIYWWLFMLLFLNFFPYIQSMYPKRKNANVTIHPAREWMSLELDDPENLSCEPWLWVHLAVCCCEKNILKFQTRNPLRAGT